MLFSINFKELRQLFRRSSKKNFIPVQEERNNQNAVHQRIRTNILFVFTLFTLTLSLYFCWGIVINPKSNPDNIKFAFTLITAIISGLVGFVTGKAVG